VNEFVDGVEKQLEGLLRRGPAPAPRLGPDLWAAARHTTLASAAKRTRPRLVYLFGQSVGAAPEDLERVAAAAELIHAASLVHDDVIDGGTVRRGQPTANVLWENITAVLSGDLMFSISFGLLRGFPEAVMSTAVEVLREMSCAAIEEVHARGDLDLSLERWRAIAAGKTGALFGWCGSAAARVVSDEEAARRFEDCGERMGVAFQLADDLKDLLADDGKDRFADVKNKNPSFPLLWAASRSAKVESALRTAWAEESLSAEAVARVGEAVVEAGALEATARALREEIEAGLEALGPLRSQPSIREVEAWAMTMLQAARLEREAA
jgi:geranylgeranyl pyrophosphate synthase